LESSVLEDAESFFVRFRNTGSFNDDCAPSELRVFRDVLVVNSKENKSS
jgi:hypothetical protein